MDSKNQQGQNVQRRFVIETISDIFKVSPIYFIVFVTILADIFWIYMTDIYKFMEGGFWWSVFGVYIYFILNTYKRELTILVGKFKKEELIEKNYTIDLYSSWLRIPAYFFWYGYFIYFSINVFNLNGNNLIDSLLNFSLIYKIGLVIYIISWVFIALPMIGDGFGILPVIWGLSEKIFENKKDKVLSINLFHEDKCAGFKPLGDFAFKLSFYIGLPFIIGMPIRIIQLNKMGLFTLTGLFNDPFSMAFLGVGLASSILFIKSSFYINRKIEVYKSEELRKISKKFEEKYTELNKLNNENPNEKFVQINHMSHEIYLLEIEIKKINEVKLPPWGETRIKQFISITVSPTTLTILLKLFLPSYLH